MRKRRKKKKIDISKFHVTSSVFLDERCYRCGNEGHYAMNCIEEWNRKCKNCFSHDHEERSCPQICYKCGNIGHVSRDCP